MSVFKDRTGGRKLAGAYFLAAAGNSSGSILSCFQSILQHLAL